MNIVGCNISLITGVMLGFELADLDDRSYLIIDLLILQILIEWEDE